MKKKILSIILVLALCLTLMPMTAFAADDFTITNGTPQSDKETNHGYITIDKTTAAENDTVTVTVNPADDYQLKSLTVAPTGFVDLGIKDAQGKPLYWKETNLGASNASDPGDYYMWGTTALMYSAVDRSKTDGAFTFVTENPYGDNYKNTWDASLGFNWNNVPFTDGVFNNASNRNVFTKYTTIDTYAKSGTPDNITTLQPEDDAATAENENWRMPTKDELAALATNCVLIWTSDYNSTGNAGYIVYKAKNDADKGKANIKNGTWNMWDAANSKYIANTGSEPTGYSTSDIHIFLPAAGSSFENKLNNLNTGGVYWSGTLGSNSDVAYGLAAMGIGIGLNQGQRQYGYSIRPVMNFSGITPAKQTDGTYQFTMPAANVTVTAEFELAPAPVYSGGRASSYAVELPANVKNGKVEVSPKNASAGQTVTLTVTPDKGFTLETLTVLDKNGKEVEVKNLGNNKFSFKMPSGKVSISATFMEDNSMLNFCVDVKASDYYYDAVLWAYENEICKGTDAVHFSPGAPVTRAQVVTFLWRAAGSPEAEHTAAVFKDVSPDAYYVKAVEWALSEGITKGTGETTFSPDAICTRGQIVAFLARFAGVADADTASAFTDVKTTDYFAAAVKWAKDNKVTEGTSATTFSPNDDCTRAQVVTFLYRRMVK